MAHTDLPVVVEAVRDEVLSRPGVVGVDVDFKYVAGRRTDVIAVRVFVREKNDQVSEENRIPPELGGLPTDVIQRTFVAFWDGDPRFPPDRRIYDPLEGGCSIGPCAAMLPPPGAQGAPLETAGTLGLLVEETATGNVLLLTNWHVLFFASAQRGTPITQPGLLDSGRCPDTTVAVISGGALTQDMDAAAGTLDGASGREYRFSILGIGDVTGSRLSALSLKELVQKHGRTTGLTVGEVDGFGDYAVTYGDRQVMLRNQFLVVPHPGNQGEFAWRGDSGSTVLDEDRQVVGLLVGGSMDESVDSEPPHGVVVTPISTVMHRLGIGIRTQFEPLAGVWPGDPAVARNADGRLEVFLVGQDGALYHSWQKAPNAAFVGWNSLGGAWSQGARPAVAANEDGRLEVFLVGQDGALYHNWQKAPNSGWVSGWTALPLGGIPDAAPCTARNSDGRLEVFLIDWNGRLQHAWQQAPNAGWSGGSSLGGHSACMSNQSPPQTATAGSRCSSSAVTATYCTSGSSLMGERGRARGLTWARSA